MVSIGLNPYGIAYSNGLMAQKTPRANPRPNTLDQYITLAQQLGVRGIELDLRQLSHLDASALAQLKERFARLGFFVVLSLCPPILDGLSRALQCAKALQARLIRMHLTPILCGDRSSPDCDWEATVSAARSTLIAAAASAREFAIPLAIENHQDFTSQDLLDLCDAAGDNVGITLDTGNPLSVAEDPVEFARRIAPRCRHVHLKDYRAQFTDEGYRLVRCPIGDGAIPFAKVLDALQPAGPLTASIEPGALCARHIRCFTSDWWRLYPPRGAEDFAAAVAAARVNRLDEHLEYRTPWESDGSPQQIVAFELKELLRSAQNLRTIGLLQ